MGEADVKESITLRKRDVEKREGGDGISPIKRFVREKNRGARSRAV